MEGSAEKREVFCTGEFEFGIDSKRRVQVPAKWRPGTVGEGFHVFIWPWRGKGEKHLFVMPEPVVNKMLTELKAESVFNEEAERKRMFLSVACQEVTLDSAGRICIPEKIAKAAAIESRAVLVGMMDHGFKIWNPERYHIWREREQTAEDAVVNPAPSCSPTN